MSNSTQEATVPAPVQLNETALIMNRIAIQRRQGSSTTGRNQSGEDSVSVRAVAGSVVEEDEEHTSRVSSLRLNTETLFTLVPGRVVGLRELETRKVYIRYYVPKEQVNKRRTLIEHTRYKARHPNVLMPLWAVKHTDHTDEIDIEYADAGTLAAFIPKFDPACRLRVAMSVARQVLMSLHYFLVVHKRIHCNICPRYIYLRRDGCVKTDLYCMFDLGEITLNWLNYFKISPYTPPECRSDPQTYNRIDSKADVWALGITMLAIMTGRKLEPPRKPERVAEIVSPATQQELNAFENECKWVDELINGDPAKLRAIIPDDRLLYLVRRCFVVEPTQRATVIELLSTTFAFGGLGVWDLEESAFEPSNFTVAGTRLKEILTAKSNANPFTGDIISPILPPLSDEMKEVVRKISQVLHAELISWSVNRIEINRQIIDRGMRDVIQKRSTNAYNVIKDSVAGILRARAAERASTTNVDET